MMRGVQHQVGSKAPVSRRSRGRVFALSVLCLSGTLAISPAPAQAGALHEAVRAADLAAIDALLAEGAEIDATDFVIGSPLHLAVSRGDMEIVRLLIGRGADIEAPSELQGMRALHLAADLGEAAIVGLLLDSGAEIDARDGSLSTPLIRAAISGRVEVVALLIDRGAAIGLRDGYNGRTALHWAAFHGWPEVVEALVDGGADLEAADAAGRTPFIFAATVESFENVGDTRLIEYLAAQGANLHASDNAGRTALGWAESRVSFLARYDRIIEVLRALGATR